MKGKTGKTAHREGRKTQSDYVQTVTNYPRSILSFPNASKTIHPTQKPLDLCKYLILSFTKEKEIVLDSCMGSGTTAVASILTDRNYVGFETDDTFFKTCMERIDRVYIKHLKSPVEVFSSTRESGLFVASNIP